MISEIFFDKSIDKRNIYLYEESNLSFLIANLIHSKEKCSYEVIKNNLDRIFGEHAFSYRKLKIFLENHYTKIKDYYFLNEMQLAEITMIDVFRKELVEKSLLSEEDLIKKICELINTTPFDKENGFVYISALIMKRTNTIEEVILSKFYDYCSTYYLKYFAIKNSVNVISDSYNYLPITQVINNNVINELLLINGISIIGDLKKLSSEELCLIFFIDLENILNSFSPLTGNFLSSYKNKVIEIYNSLNEKQYDVLDKRLGFSENKKTLEEVGAIYNLTRERCRQIEITAINNLKEKSSDVKIVLLNLYFLLNEQNKSYIDTSLVYSFVEDKILSKQILFFYEIIDTNIIYNKKLNVLFDKTRTSLEEICSEALKKFNDIIYIDEYNKMNNFEQSVVKEKYRLFYNGAYIKRNLNKGWVIGKLIQELFPNGYRISNKSDYEKAKEEFIKRFGTYKEFPSARAVSSLILKENCCQIDKGTYKYRKDCAIIPQDLINEIIDYIIKNSPTVLYRSIYCEFKVKLNSLDINNYYYLKGIIDPVLPEEFLTKRNYITIKNEKISSIQIMTQFIQSFEGVFKLDDIQNKFKGVEDYTIYNVLYNEGKKGLIFLSSKRFIYVAKLNLDNSVVLELKNFIENLFQTMQTDVLSSRKIYARLSLTNKNLLSKLKIITDSFSTFSLIKCLFNNDYSFNRPLINLNKNSKINSYGLVCNYATTLETFNSNIIKEYVLKMNIRGLNSYLEFMEDQSDEFVQIDIDTMVSKNKINIDENKLKEIRKCLDIILCKIEKTDTSNFRGYALFPQLKYHWNKYLLVGIIRSYFSEIYEIQNTCEFYDKTEFIIRRKSNG